MAPGNHGCTPGLDVSATATRDDEAASALQELSKIPDTRVASAVERVSMGTMGAHRRNTSPSWGSCLLCSGSKKANRLGLGGGSWYKGSGQENGCTRPWAATSSVTQKRGTETRLERLARARARSRAPHLPGIAYCYQVASPHEAW